MQEEILRAHKQIPEDMLRLSPNECLTFRKGDGSDTNVEITCIAQIPVTYKIQTTSPEKFRVRPRSGILNPGEKANVSILLKAEHHLSESSKDKFLIMSIPVPQSAELTSQQISELWKHKQFNSPEVEQHRLTCLYKNDDKGRNGYATGEKEGKQPFAAGGGGSAVDLSRHANQLEKQLRFTQFLQYVTLIFLLVLSIAVVYLLRLQSTSAEDDSLAESSMIGAKSCPMGRKQ